MQAFETIGGIVLGTIFATIVAAHYATRPIPADETRNSIDAVARSPLWLPVLAIPVGAALLIIADAAGWI